MAAPEEERDAASDLSAMRASLSSVPSGAGAQKVSIFRGGGQGGRCASCETSGLSDWC